MHPQKFSLSRLIKSFYYAFAGIKKFMLSERNAMLHLAATFFVLVLSLLLKVSTTEAIALAGAVGLVWVAEMFNTCLEKVMDFISAEERPEIKLIKDVSAGAVLIASGTALVIGLLIFIPKIL